jgi:surface protein
MGPMMISAAKNAKVNIAVHLDHGLRIETVQKALEMGFTSVMFDGSTLPLEENIKAVKQVREMADKYGATVEAELGVVGGNEGDGAAHEILCTNPDDAKLFCDETGVDALAVAIGNAHGNYPVLPNLRFDVLDDINKIPVKSCSSLFFKTDAESYYIVQALDLSAITNMKSMFSNMTNLISLDIVNFDTSRVDNMYEMFDTFGFGHTLGIDFYGESAGIIMNKSTSKTVDVARMGFGQAVACTPIQLMTAFSSLVNGGKLY